MSRFLSLILLLACLVLIAWFLPSTRNLNHKVGAFPSGVAAAEEESAFRILFGMTDSESAKWDGSLAVAPGAIARIEPWRFDEDDKIEESSAATMRWRISTRQGRAFGAQPQRPVVANGVIVIFRNLTSASEVSVETAQGKFSFRPADLPYGKAMKPLDGRVMVDRVTASARIAASRDEQDYPAAATDREGNVWVAYLQFTPNPKFTGIRWSGTGETKNFAELAEPAGGDQILLIRWSRGMWSEAVAVTEKGGDLYKPAVAVDGAGRVWVFWSANNGANFDLYARSFEAGKGGKTLKLTSDRGPDIAPVAATDAKGRVWVAWQGFRNERSQIRAAYQQGDKFSDEILVASSISNEWNPAIAAAPNGEVTIAWDSYRQGSYDIYLRSFDGAAKPASERAAAVTARYEAYPALTYDKEGRLWLAWEESDAGWGKDFGADETSGIGLYHGRWIRVKLWQGNRAFTPPGLDALLPGMPSWPVDAPARQSDPHLGAQPDPDLYKQRRPSATPQPPPRPRNSYPRLLADRGGRIWLAYRTAHPVWWVPIGTVWFENVVSFDGGAWTGPIFVHHSDNLLDNRPALASTAAGELLIVNSSDGRQHFHPQTANFVPVKDDPYNNDLYSSRIVLADPVKPAQLTPAAEDGTAAGVPDTPSVRRLREYRARVNNTEYRILRGEFHRHTEVSMDGGRDGSLLDAFRYMLDAAAMDWVGCCDHDNGHGREYTWWMTQKLTDIFHLQGSFIPMFSYERSVQYPEGHRNVVFAQRGVRTLPRIARVDESAPGNAPDTQMLYKYLRHFNGIVASHTSGTNMGTDWRDNDPLAEPVVEIYQGDRQNYEMPEAPRSNNANDSIGGWRPKGFISLALEKGYKLGFQASSDHISTHMSYCNLLVTAPTREALLEAFQKRHVYGATDDILADVRAEARGGVYMMGDAFETTTAPTIKVKLVGTAPFSRVHIIRNNRYVYTVEPKKETVEFTWRDEKPEAGKTSYYYVRGEQQDGEIVWVSPMWITYRASSTR
jgi:hypothetical protein